MADQNRNNINQKPSLGDAGLGDTALTGISKSNCLSRYTWGDDCYGWNFVDTDELSVKQELMPPDTSEKLHYHEKATQFFFILTGQATFLIDGAEVTLKTSEGIEIKPGQKHLIKNKGRTDLEFILYSQPSTKNDRHNAAS
jgi:mannose-6-phosphate isomerase-like protein (cupin superfamily)